MTNLIPSILAFLVIVNNSAFANEAIDQILANSSRENSAEEYERRHALRELKIIGPTLSEEDRNKVQDVLLTRLDRNSDFYEDDSSV